MVSVRCFSQRCFPLGKRARPFGPCHARRFWAASSFDSVLAGSVFRLPPAFRRTPAIVSRSCVDGPASMAPPERIQEATLRRGRVRHPRYAATPACPPFQTSGTSPHGAGEGKARDGFCGQEEGQKISPRCPRLGPRFAGSEERFAAREPIDPVDQLERRTPRAQSERPARNPAAIRHLHHMAQAVPPQFRAIRQGVRALVRVGANMKIRFKRIVTGVCNSEMAVSAVGYDH